MADAKAKAASPAVDFMAMLANETELYEVAPGIKVELRTLTFAEVQGLATQHKDNSTEMAFQSLRLGLTAPELSAEQWEQARHGKSGPLMKIAGRVMEISGMTEGNTPLAGTGS